MDKILSRRLCPRLQLALLGASLRQRHPLPLVHSSPKTTEPGDPAPSWFEIVRRLRQLYSNSDRAALDGAIQWLAARGRVDLTRTVAANSHMVAFHLTETSTLRPWGSLDVQRQKAPTRRPFVFGKLRRSDSNRRPSGYEPDELPLLHSAIRIIPAPQRRACRVSGGGARATPKGRLKGSGSQEPSPGTAFRSGGRSH